MSKLDHKKMLNAINDIVSNDWGYSVTDEMVNLPGGGYREFTQEQAREMAQAISKIYLIAHAVICTACQRKWLHSPPNHKNGD